MFRKIRLGKRGAAAVLICVIMVSVMSLSMIVIRASMQTSNLSKTNAILVLAGRSCLGEYDIPIYEKYGLFARYGDEAEIASRIKYYCEKSGGSGISVGNLDSSSYCLNDMQVLEDEIVRLVKNEAPADLLSWFSGGSFEAGRCGRGDSSKNGIYMHCSEPDFDKEKRHLPSYGDEYRHFEMPDLKTFDIDAFIRGNTDKIMLIYYLFNYFNRYTDQDIYSQSFFKYEIEYILSGKRSDEENLSALKRKFLVYRAPLNAAHILSSPEKMEKVAALAATLPPGANLTAEAAIILAWSAAETSNDWRLLLDGKNVPVVKTAETWALPLSKSLLTALPEQIVYPAVNSGLDYDKHLMLFLCFVNKECVLLRSMDIIQLNMRKNYYPEFSLKDYATGFYVECSVGKQILKYEHTY